MRGDALLDKMELIDPAYIEAADARPNQKKNGWIKWGTVACLCIVIAGFFVVSDLSGELGFVAPGPTGRPDVVQPMQQPAIFNSIDDFVNSVKKVDPKYDANDLSSIMYYFVPSDAIKGITLDSINVHERYVCIYYHLQEEGDTKYFSADKEEIARISNTVTLEWIRDTDGETLLKNTIEQLSLKKIRDGVYCYDISYPTQPDIVLSKSLYWVCDGYMFHLDVPQKIFEALTAEYGAGDAIERITKVNKVMI